MDVFGPHWRDHAQRIETAWREQIADTDLVLLAGDISWAMRLTDVVADLAWIDSLPGRKVLCKGNHDYWWNSRSRARSVLPPSMELVDCDAVRIDVRLREQQIHHPRSQQKYVTVSGGVAIHTARPEDTAERFLGAEETALARAKEQGRNRIIVAEEVDFR